MCFILELNNLRKRRNNVAIFNVDFRNVWQRWNNFANVTIFFFLKKSSLDSKTKYSWASKNMLDSKSSKSSSFSPILKGICKRIFAEPQKFLKHRIYWITKSIFKSSHFVKCQLVFNFKRQVQAHYDNRSFNFRLSFKCVRKS